MHAQFAAKYGPWAVVAGASEGLGAAFAGALARRGLNLLLFARRGEQLEAVAAPLRAAVEVRTAALDLAAPDLAERLAEASAGLDVALRVQRGGLADRALPGAARSSASLWKPAWSW